MAASITARHRRCTADLREQPTRRSCSTSLRSTAAPGAAILVPPGSTARAGRSQGQEGWLRPCVQRPPTSRSRPGREGQDFPGATLRPCNCHRPMRPRSSAAHSTPGRYGTRIFALAETAWRRVLAPLPAALHGSNAFFLAQHRLYRRCPGDRGGEQTGQGRPVIRPIATR